MDQTLDEKQASVGAHAALPPDPWCAACPSREIIDLIASKWVLLVIPLLRSGPMRTNDLLRAVQGLSQKMLTQTLRGLEQRGLVLREDFGEVPPKVEYSLSPLGHSLAERLTALDAWVIDNYNALQVPALR